LNELKIYICVIFKYSYGEVDVYWFHYCIMYDQVWTQTLMLNWTANDFQRRKKCCKSFKCSNSKCPSNADFSIWKFSLVLVMKSPKLCTSLLVYLWCLQEQLHFSKYSKRVYIHAHTFANVCRNRLYLSCKCISVSTHRTTPQHTQAQHWTLTPVVYVAVLSTVWNRLKITQSTRMDLWSRNIQELLSDVWRSSQ
jgi:hypothetical protein